MALAPIFVFTDAACLWRVRGDKSQRHSSQLQSDVHPVMSKAHVNPWLCNVKRLHVASGPKKRGHLQCAAASNFRAMGSHGLWT